MHRTATLAAFLLAASAHAQTSYWPPNFSIDRVQCIGTIAEIDIRVHGTWFCPIVPTGVRFTPGNVAQFITVEWDFNTVPDCAAIPTPWQYTLTIQSHPIDQGRNIPILVGFDGPLSSLQTLSIGAYFPSCNCPADRDDGTGQGHPDGGITIDDLLYYLTIYERGIPAADIDDGTGTGARDGGVTIDDLLYYLARFEAGC